VAVDLRGEREGRGGRIFVRLRAQNRKTWLNGWRVDGEGGARARLRLNSPRRRRDLIISRPNGEAVTEAKLQGEGEGAEQEEEEGCMLALRTQSGP
jgi:hypothetical protein